MPPKIANRVSSLALVLGLAAAPATAQEPEFHPNLRHWCQDPWMLSTGSIRECLDADYRRADAELNRVYQEKMASLNPRQREALRDSQRAWLRRYDATLTSYYSTEWGNHSVIRVLPSQIRAVRDRTEWLRRVRVEG